MDDEIPDLVDLREQANFTDLSQTASLKKVPITIVTGTGTVILSSLIIY